MKKLWAIGIVSVLAVATLTACGSQPESSPSAGGGSATEQSEADPLSGAKVAAIDELEAWLTDENLSKYEDPDKEIIQMAVEQGEKAIDEADSEEAIRQAKEEALTKCKSLTTIETKKEKTAEAKDKKAVTDVESKIKAIGDTISSKSGEAIKAARNAYDALTDGQKKLVENYDDLKQAEQLLSEVKAADTAQEEQANYEVAWEYQGEPLSSLIQTLGKPKNRDITDHGSLGKEGWVYWDGVAVYVDSDKPGALLIIQEVEEY